MNTAGEALEHDSDAVGGPQIPEPSIVLSPAQRKALAQLCRLHHQGYNPWQFSRRSLLLALYIAFTLAFSVLVLNMTAFAPPAYLFLGFVLGTLLNNLKIMGSPVPFGPSTKLSSTGLAPSICSRSPMSRGVAARPTVTPLEDLLSTKRREDRASLGLGRTGRRGDPQLLTPGGSAQRTEGLTSRCSGPRTAAAHFVLSKVDRAGGAAELCR